MKTPRELLLARHEEAKAKLDAIRRGVVNEIGSSKSVPQTPRVTSLSVAALMMTMWRELIWPSRRAWSTIVFIWAAMLVWNIAETDAYSPRQQAHSDAGSGMVQNLVAQRHLLSELLDVAPQRRTEPAPPRNQPRTAIIPDLKLC